MEFGYSRVYIARSPHLETDLSSLLMHREKYKTDPSPPQTSGLSLEELQERARLMSEVSPFSFDADSREHHGLSFDISRVVRRSWIGPGGISRSSFERQNDSAAV